MKITSPLLLLLIAIQVHARRSSRSSYGSYGGSYSSRYSGYGGYAYGGYGSYYSSSYSYYVYRSQYPYGMSGLKQTYDYMTYESFFAPCDPLDLDCQQYSNTVDLVTSVVTPLIFCIFACTLGICAKLGTCCKKKTVESGSAPTLEVVNLD